MADCEGCGVKLKFFRDTVGDYCDDCYKEIWTAEKQSREQARQEEANAAEENKVRVASILLTTETAPNLNITKRIEIVTAECAFGMNIFKDLFAGVRDIVGGRSEAVQKTMRDSRKTALYELKVEADLVGANAVVGVDLDYVELSSSGGMVMLVASGTAVVIED